jgi:glycosyltransferase involved in cell wall biosynthesis
MMATSTSFVVEGGYRCSLIKHGYFLEACVESILRQSITDIRVLIIDDASSDDSLLVAKLQTKESPLVLPPLMALLNFRAMISPSIQAEDEQHRQFFSTFPVTFTGEDK